MVEIPLNIFFISSFEFTLERYSKGFSILRQFFLTTIDSPLSSPFQHSFAVCFGICCVSYTKIFFLVHVFAVFVELPPVVEKFFGFNLFSLFSRFRFCELENAQIPFFASSKMEFLETSWISPLPLKWNERQYFVDVIAFVGLSIATHVVVVCIGEKEKSRQFYYQSVSPVMGRELIDCRTLPAEKEAKKQKKSSDCLSNQNHIETTTRCLRVHRSSLALFWLTLAFYCIFMFEFMWILFPFL